MVTMLSDFATNDADAISSPLPKWLILFQV